MAKITTEAFGETRIELSNGHVIYVIGRGFYGWQLADADGEWANPVDKPDIESLAEWLERKIN